MIYYTEKYSFSSCNALVAAGKLEKGMINDYETRLFFCTGVRNAPELGSRGYRIWRKYAGCVGQRSDCDPW
jgi:hypothetical protein